VTVGLTVAVLAVGGGLAILLTQRLLGLQAGLTRRLPLLDADMDADAAEVLP